VDKNGVGIIIIIEMMYPHSLAFVTIWDPKNVHFYLMYLKHGSIIGLMMTLCVETCRHIYN